MKVQTGLGVISLPNVHFNCDSLNEKLAGLPIQLSSFFVEELYSHISYGALVSNTESNFTLKNVHITLSPASSIELLHSSGIRLNGVNNQSNEDLYESGGTENNDNEGFQYLSNWIDTIIAHIMCTVEDIHITLVGIDESNPSSTLTIHVKNLIFHNSDPRMNSTQDIPIPNSNTIRNNSKKVRKYRKIKFKITYYSILYVNSYASYLAYRYLSIDKLKLKLLL